MFICLSHLGNDASLWTRDLWLKAVSQNKEVYVKNSGQEDQNQTLSNSDNSKYEDISIKEVIPNPKRAQSKPLLKNKNKTE